MFAEIGGLKVPLGAGGTHILVIVSILQFLTTSHTVNTSITDH
jgi:hypothetical protein